MLRVPCDAGIAGISRAPRQPPHLRDAQPRHARRRHPQGGWRRNGARGRLDRGEPGQGVVLARPHAGRRPGRILSTHSTSHQQSPLGCSLRGALHTPHGVDSPDACGDRAGIASTAQPIAITGVWRVEQGIKRGSVCAVTCVTPFTPPNRAAGALSSCPVAPLMLPAAAVGGGCAGGKWAKCGGAGVRPRYGASGSLRPTDFRSTGSCPRHALRGRRRCCRAHEMLPRGYGVPT